MPKIRSDVYRWLGAFAGVYVLAFTIFTILAVWWTREPAFPPNVGNETCAPYRNAESGTASCLA